MLVVGALMAAIAAGGALFGFAPEARAGTSDCLAGVLAGKLLGTTAVLKTKASGVGMNVPTNSKAANDKLDANSKIAGNTSGQTQGFTVQRCIVEPLVTTMARSLLNTFTAQTVRWINSGFKGSPLYVTNPQGFLTDIADQTLGQFIQGLGPIGQILCSPFDYQLRLSLNIQFGPSDYYQEIGCRLTDIQQNIQRTFTGGSWGQNGWDSWLELTATPQHNVYGAYIRSVDLLGSQIAGKQEIASKQLDWGKGFLSSTKCTEYATEADEAADTGLSAGDCKQSEIETPGSLIEDQLSETLGQQVRNVGLAKDIDAILNALVNQMINQVMGGVGGLLGGGGRSSTYRAGGIRNYQGGYYPTSPNQNYGTGVLGAVTENRLSQNLPEGVLPTNFTPTQFCQTFRNNLYFRDTTDNTIKTKVGTVVNGRLVHAEVAVTSYKVVDGKTVPWTIDDYNNVSLFCRNAAITETTGAATKRVQCASGRPRCRYASRYASAA